MQPAIEEYIKACPHCGGSASLTASFSYRIRKYFVFVKCDICGAQGKIYNSAEDPSEHNWNNQSCTDAVNAWNMRHREEE